MIFVFLIFFNIFYFIKYLADVPFHLKSLPLRQRRRGFEPLPRSVGRKIRINKE